MGLLDDIKSRLPFGQNQGGYGHDDYDQDGYDDYYDDGYGADDGYQGGSGYGQPQRQHEAGNGVLARRAAARPSRSRSTRAPDSS